MINARVTEVISKVILAKGKIRIKLLGDSITHGMGGTGFKENGELIVQGFLRNKDGYCWAKLFKEYMESRFNCEVINNGCSGTKIEFIIDNFNELVDEEDDIIICTIGTNNRNQDYKDAPKRMRSEHMKYVYGKIIELHTLFKKANKDVIFVANIPASKENEKDGADFWRLIHMNDINDIYMKASIDCNFPFISMYSLFWEYCELKDINVSSLLKDGLHPNDKGYEVIFKLLMKELGIGIRID